VFHNHIKKQLTGTDWLQIKVINNLQLILLTCIIKGARSEPKLIAFDETYLLIRVILQHNFILVYITKW
jgi:hypothetical protein